MITVKGKPMEWHHDLTVRSVLEKMGMYGKLVFVQVDEKRINSSDWDVYPIPDGATIDIFPMVLGG